MVKAQDAGNFAVPSSDVGTTVSMNGKWLFTPANEAKEVGVPVPQMLSRIQWWLDDSEDFKKWEQARLDALGFDCEKSDEGWYRAIIDVPELPKDRHLWIEFDGVAMKCRTLINGLEVGKHEGMFSRFSYDLTPHLKAGKNELKVWVSMEKFSSSTATLGEAVTVNLSASKVVSMNKGMFGPLAVGKPNREYDLYGIWQPVKLVVRGPFKLEDVSFKPYLDGADVRVDLGFVDGSEQFVATGVLTDVKTGQQLAKESKEFGANAKVNTTHLRFNGLKPKLWTPAEPNLYRLDVSLERDGKLIDHRSDNVGFRTFEVKGNQFYLNGHRYWLRGANQLPYGKNPWDPALAKKLIQLMHDGNERFTRTHATPWNEAWLDAADEIGLAVSIEGPRPWALAGKAAEGEADLMPPPAIYQHWLDENADIIKRCRNHPSVFIYTIGNEMNLRDGKNMEKWKLLSGVVKQTKEIDPTRPTVSTSSYNRETKFYEEEMKPAGIDDGDIDDLHDYNAWYGNSNFIFDVKYDKQLKDNQKKRPLIGQEFSTGYPDLDTGMPCMRYTRDLLTPQAWVGVHAYPGHDRMIWLEHLSKVTKRWAEQLRCERGDNTAGFSMFSAECWFKHSYEPGSIEPYPVYEAMKQAFAPIGLALESTQRRFWTGDTLATNVFVTNDDDQFRDLSDLKVVCHIEPVGGGEALGAAEPVALAKLAYYETAKVAVKLNVTAAAHGPRMPAVLVMRLINAGGKEMSRNTETVEIFARPAEAAKVPENVIVVKKGEPLAGLAEGKELHEKIAAGATAIVFSPSNKEIAALFPKALFDDAKEAEEAKKIADAKAATRKSVTTRKAPAKKPAAKATTAPAAEKKADIAEFADLVPCLGTKLAENLQPMDLKWWARKGDWRAFIAHSSERLKPDGPGRELLRYIPAHSYISADKIPEQYRTVLCEIPVGKGRVWICNLDIEASAGIDPAANLFAENLYRAAADGESTKMLPTVPSHEELLKGGK